MKEEIMSFDALKITPEIRSTIQELLDKHVRSFDPAVSPCNAAQMCTHSLYDLCMYLFIVNFIQEIVLVVNSA